MIHVKVTLKATIKQRKTWEDMMLISGIMEDLLNSKESVDMDEVEYWTETLKRFNEERSKK